MAKSFTSKREAALALLNRVGQPEAKALTKKSGSFLGQLACEPPETLSALQAEWLDDLLTKNGFAPFGGSR